MQQNESEAHAGKRGLSRGNITMEIKEIIELILSIFGAGSILAIVGIKFISKWIVSYLVKDAEIQAQSANSEELKKVTNAVEEVKVQLAKKNIEYQIRYSKNYESAIFYSTEIIKNLVLLTEYVMDKYSYIYDNKDNLALLSRNYKENYFKLSLLIDGKYRNDVLQIANDINSTYISIIDKSKEINSMKNRYKKSQSIDEKNKIKESFKRTLERMEKMKKSSDFFNKNKKLRNALRKALSNSTFS